MYYSDDKKRTEIKSVSDLFMFLSAARTYQFSFLHQIALNMQVCWLMNVYVTS